MGLGLTRLRIQVADNILYHSGILDADDASQRHAIGRLASLSIPKTRLMGCAQVGAVRCSAGIVASRSNLGNLR